MGSNSWSHKLAPKMKVSSSPPHEVLIVKRAVSNTGCLWSKIILPWVLLVFHFPVFLIFFVKLKGSQTNDDLRQFSDCDSRAWWISAQTVYLANSLFCLQHEGQRRCFSSCQHWRGADAGIQGNNNCFGTWNSMIISTNFQQYNRNNLHNPVYGVKEYIPYLIPLRAKQIRR